MVTVPEKQNNIFPARRTGDRSSSKVEKAQDWKGDGSELSLNIQCSSVQISQWTLHPLKK